MLKSLTLAAALVISSGAYALAADAPQVGETSKGQTLVDGSGNTLYFYSDDTDGVSNCDHLCAFLWPPLHADEGATAQGDYTLQRAVMGRSNGPIRVNPSTHTVSIQLLEISPGMVS